MEPPKQGEKLKQTCACAVAAAGHQRFAFVFEGETRTIHTARDQRLGLGLEPVEEGGPVDCRALMFVARRPTLDRMH